MATWREATAAKTERQRRQRRHYRRHMLGRPCPVCGVPMPLALLEAGMNDHPTCGPEWRALGGASS